MMQSSNNRCYPCEEPLSRREVFYLYFCHNCQNKTPYCKKCDKTMDCILDSSFFKCMLCRSLMKINMRETIVPDNNFPEMNSSPNKCSINEINQLFQSKLENSTPIRNLFSNQNINQCIGTTSNPINPIHLRGNLNLMEKSSFNISKNSDIFQTPKSTSKINNTLIFSPDEKNMTPIPERTVAINNQPENLINLKNLGRNSINTSTPRSINQNHSNYKSHSGNSPNLCKIEESFKVDDFDKILNFQNFQSTHENTREIRSNQNNNLRQNFLLNKSINSVNLNQISNNSDNYSLLASKNRTGRIMNPSEPLIPTINKINSSNDSNIYAGYNKTESSRRVSKSPLSLRKSKPKLNLEDPSLMNIPLPVSTPKEKFSISENTLNNSIIKFKDQNLQPIHNFGASSQLSDIKPIRNYNTELQFSNFSYGNY